MARHYVIAPSNEGFLGWPAACGAVCTWFDQWTRFPNLHITCAGCRESPTFKEDEIQFEVGFESDLDNWMNIGEPVAQILQNKPKQQEDGQWYDRLLPRIRMARMTSGLSDEALATMYVSTGQATAEQVWLCLKSAEILDG